MPKKIYPYQFDIKGDPYPLVPFSVLSDKKERRDYFALIDSGAIISFFREDIAERLGIEIEKGEEITLKGIGGWIKGYKHELHLEVSKKIFSCPVVFSREYFISLNILGRNSFFEKFKITFDEAQKRVILT